MSQTTESSGDNDRCFICLEAFVQNSVSTSSPSSSLSPDAKQKDPNTNKIHNNFCGHRVHAACLHSSIKAGIYSCPVCRQPLSIGGDGEQRDSGTIHASTTTSSRKLKKYTKMLQSQIPAAAVKQCMMVDGISSRDVDAFFTDGTSREVATSAGIIENDDDDDNDATFGKDWDKYKKMLEMGIPEGAVRNKMAVVGCYKPDVIDRFFDQIYNEMNLDGKAKSDVKTLMENVAS